MSRGSLLLLLSLLAVFPASAKAQLTRLDSILAQTLPIMVLQPGHSGPIIIHGDSDLAPLLGVVPNPVGTSLPMFYIEYLGTSINSRDAANAKLNIEMRGVFLNADQPVSHKAIFTKTLDIRLSADDNASLARHESHYLERIYDSYVSQSASANDNVSGTSFWSSTVEPALVVISAVAIVALFFLVRS